MTIQGTLARIAHPRTVGWLLASSLVLLLLTSVLWWQQVHQNPRVVFENMLRKNMMTSGYTRTTTQTGQGTIERTSQVQLGDEAHIRTLETITQAENQQITEYLTTQDDSFARIARYPDPAVTNVWAKLPSSETFDQEIVEFTFFPMGSVTEPERTDLLHFIDENNVYSPNYQSVKKEVVDGKTVYTYDVTVQLQAYAAMIQRFSGAIGFTELSNNTDPAAFAGAEPFALRVSVDTVSHRLVQTMAGADVVTTENFSGYDIVNQPLALPESFISAEELQQRIGQ